jgi:phytoene dehydrogenase-like protein
MAAAAIAAARAKPTPHDLPTPQRRPGDSRAGHFHADNARVEWPVARRAAGFRDPDRLEAELPAKAPQDAAAIRQFVGLIRKLARVRMPEGDSFLQNIGTYLGYLPVLPALSKHSKLSMADYSKRFTHPILRAFFAGGIGELSFLAIVFSLAWMAEGNAGYPIGGSPRFIGLIEDNYRKLGGRIRFKSRVERIQVEDGRAVGVLLQGGETLRADIVVSAADGHATIFDMLGGRFTDDRIRKIYETYKPFPSYVMVSLDVDADLAGEPGLVALLRDPRALSSPGAPPVRPRTAHDRATNPLVGLRSGSVPDVPRRRPGDDRFAEGPAKQAAGPLSTVRGAALAAAPASTPPRSSAAGGSRGRPGCLA